MINRNHKGECLRCGDTQITPTGDCFYCNWKGWEGPGLKAKQIIKEVNKKNKHKGDKHVRNNKSANYSKRG